MSTSNKGSSFLKQGSILAISGIIARLIGLAYRIPVTNIIGTEGIYIYSPAINLYSLLLIVSSYSIPLAVSKMVSVRSINREHKNAFKILKGAMAFAIFSGGIAAFFLYFGAGFLENTLYAAYPGISIPFKVLSPAIFIMAIVGVLRGYYQGKQTMMPTAFSQIFEQVVNAFISVFGALALMKAHSASNVISAWGAAGSTLGTAMGAGAACLFLLFVYVLYRPTIKRQLRRDVTKKEESYKEIYIIIILTIMPVILSQAIYNVSGVIDDMIFGNIMEFRGFPKSKIQLYGIYSSVYRLLVNVPIAISTSIAASLVPSVVGSFAQGYLGEVKEKVHSAVKFNMLIAFPAALGLTVLGEPVVRMLFSSVDFEVAGNLFKLGAMAIIFYAWSTVTSGVLQSINQMKLPVIHSALALVLHIILIFVLLMVTNLGVYVLVIGNVTYPILVCILNQRALRKYVDYRQEWRRTFFVPLGCSVLMASFTYLTYIGTKSLLHSNVISTLLAILVAVFVYFVSMILTKGIEEEEMYDMPFGRKMIIIARKLHLF